MVITPTSGAAIIHFATIVDVASVCELDKITTFAVVSMSLEDCGESAGTGDLNGLKVLVLLRVIF